MWRFENDDNEHNFIDIRSINKQKFLFVINIIQTKILNFITVKFING